MPYSTPSYMVAPLYGMYPLAEDLCLLVLRQDDLLKFVLIVCRVSVIDRLPSLPMRWMLMLTLRTTVVALPALDI